MDTVVATGAKVERKWLAHFINASFSASEQKYVRLGKDLEEYKIELNPDGEEKTNIIGESRYDLKGYKPSSTVDPYYAYVDDELFPQLKKIVDERATGAATQTTIVDVYMSPDGAVVDAWQEEVIVVPTSYGGDTAGVSIAFEVHNAGNRVKGTFDMKTKVFTPDSTKETETTSGTEE